MGLKKHGITSETIKNMILGAGVIYKNLKYEKPSNGWTGTPLGATSGGLKFNYQEQETASEQTEPVEHEETSAPKQDKPAKGGRRNRSKKESEDK